MRYYLFYLALPLVFFGCTSVPESEQTHSPIYKQILRSRSGRLSNSACAKSDPKNCIPDVVSYDLEDAGTRKLLNDAKFFCLAGGRLFHICPNTAAICRKGEGVVTRRFLGIPTQRTYPEEVIMQGAQFDALSVTCKSVLNK